MNQQYDQYSRYAETIGILHCFFELEGFYSACDIEFACLICAQSIFT